ncbi:MAG: ParB/RepB/Spo0J family partition protein [Bacteriovoracaceae bacterium]|jgi:ParB family chromosome partitioning protein|nr:ParB/RepB/Spo0J family partition protein [Bacteriovoracaceae bacterium]
MQTISIDEISISNPYLRINTNVDKLKKSIETVGLINPLVINNKNELIAGGRRYKALRELGYSHVNVVIVEKDEKEQELISIDENLVRKDLTKIEFEKCLSRGKEIYEEIYPQAKKVAQEDLTTPQDNEIQVELPNDRRSFIDITAQKTGLSKKVIKSAIDRDEKSSKAVKELRKNGELNASQANEIIKLEKEEQEKIIDLVKEKSAKEIKDIVKSVSQKGVDQTIEEVISKPSLSKEYKSAATLAKRLNKIMGKILLEEMSCEHEQMDKITKELNTLNNQILQVLKLNHITTTTFENDNLKENLQSSKIFSEQSVSIGL